jgi:mevalonate kinase
MEKAFKKITISMCPSTLEKVETFAEKQGLTRSAAITVLVNQAYEDEDVLTLKGTRQELYKRLKTMNIILTDGTSVKDFFAMRETKNEE